MVRVWSLLPLKLREMKGSDLLKDIDRDADDVLVRMMDDRTAETSRIFLGHSGPIYRCSFSPDKTLLLSCSEDSTIRLWSLNTMTCVVVYRGHTFPVWDVKFSPHGHYFVTSSHDKTARLWSTDSHQPLRIFLGHLSDVDVNIYLFILLRNFFKIFFYSAFNFIRIQIILQLAPVIVLYDFGTVFQGIMLD